MGGPAIFDPALRNYSAGYREGDPTFASDEDRRRWQAARTALLEHAMRIVAESRWKEHVMLRGSALLTLFLGDEARSPGDIDWVILTPGWTSTCDETEAMLNDIAQRFTEQGRVGEATVDPEQVARDPIWTYERADGMRLTFIGTIAGLPPLKVQCDFVFGETPWEPPMPMSIPTSDHREIALSAVSPELSLAWKLLWLLTDMYPQGKDLYDAVMLAERYPLPQPLLDRLVAAVCEEKGEYWRGTLSDASFEDVFEKNFVEIEWAPFAVEYPWVDPDLEGWIDRLKQAVPMLWDPEVWRR
ncbi:MAG: nucleotidyl transferase AbiEii/AbiGii toxin family protein [Xanthomonadaceae bacterium]|nr:nucleotidyl transferase AbiEii/AbiGii toxin family protein [Xanthomonadaceae bacterium]